MSQALPPLSSARSHCPLRHRPEGRNSYSHDPLYRALPGKAMGLNRKENHLCFSAEPLSEALPAVLDELVAPLLPGLIRQPLASQSDILAFSPPGQLVRSKDQKETH